MKLLKSKPFAIFVMIAVILLASFYGIKSKPTVDAGDGGVKLDESLSTKEYEQYIADEAGVLSAKTEKLISTYNANWVQTANRVLAVVTVEGTPDLESDAWDWGEYLQLYDDDAVLLIDVENESYTIAAAGTFYDDLGRLPGSFLDDAMQSGVRVGDYDAAVLTLFEALHPINASASGFSGGTAGASARVSVIVMLVLLVIFLIMIFSMIDSMRYSRWNARYGSMPTPPVVYRPILWWHRPGGRWYRRHRMSPPPPPRPAPPRPPMGGGRPPMGGGYRPPMSGGHRPPSRPSAPSRPSGGNFSGGRSGGSFGSSRGGNFSGGRSGGSFGGNRGGSFGGGSRGGSFGGGSRGGSFGGGSRGRR